MKINMDEEKVSRLESLVDELLQDQMNEKKVRDLMRQEGLRYSQDPVERLNRVLFALQFEEPEKDFNE